MADLDNFFAKKDKKKVKGRKYDNPDEIAKRLKESEKKLEKDLGKTEPIKKTLDEVLSTTSSKPATGNEPVPEPKPEKILSAHLVKNEEEEWKDFQDESQKDLTNLKISKLQIEDEEDNGLGYGSGEEEGGSGVGSKADGVWNKNVERSEQDNSVAEAESAAVPSSKVDPKSQTGSSYVPPHMRNANPSSLPRGSGGGSRKNKTAPDITNAMAFPSLSDSQTASPAGAWGGRRKLGDDRGFEDVKHGSSKMYTDNHGPPKLSTANRFDALCDNS